MSKRQSWGKTSDNLPDMRCYRPKMQYFGRHSKPSVGGLQWALDVIHIYRQRIQSGMVTVPYPSEPMFANGRNEWNQRRVNRYINRRPAE